MKWFKTAFLIGLGMASLALVGAVLAQSGGTYEVSTFTIDDGGRYSAGGPYWVGGTIGQPDSGVHSGGTFELTGGFWRIKEEYPTAVRLRSLMAAGNGAGLWLPLSAFVVLIIGLMAWRRKSPVR